MPLTSPAPLQQLRRVSWRSAIQVALLVLAVTVLVRTIAGLDLEALADALADTAWSTALVGLVVAQTPRAAQALSTIGAAPGDVPFRPVYLLQLAQGYIGLAVPSSAARIALNVRFFQKQGFSSGAALAIGGVDGFAGFLVEVVLLAGILLVSPATVQFDLDEPDLPEWAAIVGWMLVVAVLVAAVTLLLPHRRQQAIAWFRGLLSDGRAALRGLGSTRRLLLLFGGNLGATVLNAVTLGLFASALGTRVGLGELIVVTVTVSLLSGLLPVPGGIGVVEGGLTFGLVATGMPEEEAFAAVALHRLATFYLPPIWGFPAFRRLERDGLL